jgi:predicted metal-binding protein
VPSPLLFVCTTCPRDGETAGAARGSQLARALQAAIDARGMALEVREVACLNGCLSPCNVALRGARRWTWRFSHCTLQEVDALLGVAGNYWHAADGRLAPSALPAALQEKLSAGTPPPA